MPLDRTPSDLSPLVQHVPQRDIRVVVPRFPCRPAADLDRLLRAPVDAGIALGAVPAPAAPAFGHGNVPRGTDPLAGPAPVACSSCMEPAGGVVERGGKGAGDAAPDPQENRVSAFRHGLSSVPGLPLRLPGSGFLQRYTSPAGGGHPPSGQPGRYSSPG